MPDRTTELARARELVQRLAAMERGSASDGERQAAELIAGELDGAVEPERVHGTHWLPFGIPPLVAALTRNRLLGLLAAASILEDISGGPQLLRRALPQRTTYNVVARVGDGPEHLVLVAHHDTARTGLVFHPRLARHLAHGSTAQAFAAPIGGPLLIAAGAKRIGVAVSAIAAAAFADIALRRRPVPGANDNASGVAALVLLAARLRERPPAGATVTFVSTGSEETWLEGMAAFARRHFADLPKERTTVIAVDTIGYEHLVHGDDFPGAFPTDALIAIRAGYDARALLSRDSDGLLPGYHTHADTPDRVDFETILRAVDHLDGLCGRRDSNPHDLSDTRT